MDALQLGIFAALLQVAGYAFYGSKILSRDIRPNAVSWLMFAYGTTLLLVLEWDRNAGLPLLILPAACALASIVVAFYALQRAPSWLPEHALERSSFGLDVLLTIVYVSTWLLLLQGVINESEKGLAELFILILINIGIFTSFFPLLRQVYVHPATEHAMPWVTWTCAYILLAMATFSIEGRFNELMLYPLINIVIHAFIATHTALWRVRHGLSLV